MNRGDVPGILADALRNHRAGQAVEAERLYRLALSCDPNNADCHNLLGLLFLDTGRLDPAIDRLRQAVAHNGAVGSYHSNLGNALKARGQLPEAVASYCDALQREPNDALALSNLGAALWQQRRLDVAAACLENAIALRPDLPEAHANLALVLLAQGHLPRGWAEHEWRWKTPQMIGHVRHFPQPRWGGEAGGGQTLLIHAEQGLGDTLQFCRYAPLAAATGWRVVMAVQAPLVRLLRGLPGVERVVASGEALPHFDCHCPMLTLPLAMGTTLSNIPGTVPYLHADAAQVAAWRTRLPEQRRIGLAWAGNASLGSDRRRSLPPERLAPLVETPGARFFSLQKGGPPAPASFGLSDFMPEIHDLADTAALIASLDLVISVDTAVAHLAAALGKPVWLLDRFDSDWRWLTGRRDSPWYPTLRIFRQPEAGAWDPVLAEVAAALRQD
jgi:Flp pilus assembly protein TadD